MVEIATFSKTESMTTPEVVSINQYGGKNALRDQSTKSLRDKSKDSLSRLNRRTPAKSTIQSLYTGAAWSTKSGK